MGEVFISQMTAANVEDILRKLMDLPLLAGQIEKALEKDGLVEDTLCRVMSAREDANKPAKGGRKAK